MENSTQYSFDGENVFRPVGKTQDELPNGMYAVEASWTGPYLKKMNDVTHDELINVEESEVGLVIREINKFWTLRHRFEKFGLTYKRGFLLYGPPGTGKTSITNMIAKQMVADGNIVLYPKTGPDRLIPIMKGIRSAEKNRRIVVIIEDIDKYMRYGEEELLSLLDGQDSIDNVVYVATTNYIDEVPDRIKNRPSRFDRSIEVGAPSEELRRTFIRSKLVISNAELDNWVSKTAGMSVAQIKELIISVSIFDNDFDSEIERLKASTMDEPEKDDEDDFSLTE